MNQFCPDYPVNYPGPFKPAPIPPIPPYANPGYYMCDCCTHMHQPTAYNKYPGGGRMQESAFMIVNTVPYLIDNTLVDYGTKLSVSESIYTRITSRKDISCVNLAGTIDMTGNLITNTAQKAFLVDTIANQYETLDDVLSILYSTIQFKVYFHVEDGQGGVVYESSVNAYAQKYKFHYTDVHDFFVTSCKQLCITEIPSLDFQGIYTLILDRIEASMNVLQTKNHIASDFNPYYQFTNNNTSIAVQHDTIQSETPDGSIVVASVDLNWGIAFQANLTTKFQFSFTAFMSNTIAVGDTIDVYNALFNPTPEIVDKLEQQVNMLTDIVATLQTQATVKYNQGVSLKQGQLVWLTVGEVYQAANDFITDNTSGKTVAESLEIDINAGKLVQLHGGE